MTMTFSLRMFQFKVSSSTPKRLDLEANVDDGYGSEETSLKSPGETVKPPTALVAKPIQ